MDACTAAGYKPEIKSMKTMQMAANAALKDICLCDMIFLHS